MAQLHHWHHSQRASEAKHNYGGNLIFWDLVFGTRWLPTDREPPVETGIEELSHFPASYDVLMAAPFRWRNLVTESGPRTEVAGGETPSREPQ
jgi:sterol desaturase/sphingolipid hydroxylase (fatty acid hydroxylase superfamily)